MTFLARGAYHRALEEILAWLEFIHDDPTPPARDLLIFTHEVLPRFSSLLPDLIASLNKATSDPISGEPPKFRGAEISPPPPYFEPKDITVISGRVRSHISDENPERQCIGPVVGQRGSCVGRGAATAGWQIESSDTFARKRNHYQARCKACDRLRNPGRQHKLTRRASAARVWLELSEQARESKDPSSLLRQFRKLSLTFLEELRDDWWSALQHAAHRLIEVSGHKSGEPWLAVDVDRKLIFAARDPSELQHAADDDDRLLILFQRDHL